MKIIIVTLAVLLWASSAYAQKPTLVKRLGYKVTDKLLIVNSDDVGMSYEANAATIDGMENGPISSGTIVVPSLRDLQRKERAK